MHWTKGIVGNGQRKAIIASSRFAGSLAHWKMTGTKLSSSVYLCPWNIQILAHFVHPARNYTYILSPASSLARHMLSGCPVKECTLPARTAVYRSVSSEADT